MEKLCLKDQVPKPSQSHEISNISDEHEEHELKLALDGSPDLPKGLKPNFRWSTSASRRSYAKNFMASNPLNLVES